jgi:hypothetical protein
MSQNILVMNSEGPETRVAVIENGALAELYVELGLDRLNYHARWCVCLGDCRCQAVTHRDTP